MSQANDTPRLLAIDPGPTLSAWCVLEGRTVECGKLPNHDLLHLLRQDHFAAQVCAIEMLAGSYGQAVGSEVMYTALWVGRYAEAWQRGDGPEALLLPRKTCVTHVTDNPKAGDPHVRQALIDRWGGDGVALAKPQTCAACRGKGDVAGSVRGGARVSCGTCGGAGKVGAPGPLLHVTKDMWAALAVAVTAREQGARP
jgi:hypothetical protein